MSGHYSRVRLNAPPPPSENGNNPTTLVSHPLPSDVEHGKDSDSLQAFCPRSTFTNELQKCFVARVRICLFRRGSQISGNTLIAALQDDFTPELFVHPEFCARPNIYSSLTEKLVQVGIVVAPFALCERKSRALLLERLTWFGNEYQHEQDVAEFIVHNCINPVPDRAISLSTPPSLQDILHGQPFQSVKPPGIPTWHTPNLGTHPYPSATVQGLPIQTPQEHALQQAVQRFTFEDNSKDPAQPGTHANTLALSTAHEHGAPEYTHPSRMNRNTADYRVNQEYQKPALAAFLQSMPHQKTLPNVNPPYNNACAQNVNPYYNPQSLPQHHSSDKHASERQSKLAVAFSTAFKDTNSQ
ncbi:hypothetical protein BWQ96_04445 [Gracilariopsis chorda]|uniref:Uncharacterized protein n=1 Tax=Gracilariopsis chorda TaxID=448386 RepID=A0A2V3IUF4_9FLOR|nr:hypothetical protein BWQ96_04445 [Gracilariopsis chorda]|eukprot:PXF45778.1 hypothetical protein BWQ96_04445 [Gracilariopsis chorda]